MNSPHHPVRSVFISLLAISFVIGYGSFTQSSVLAKDHSKRSIIVLQDNISDSEEVAKDLGRANGFSFDHVYKKSLKGFSANVPTARLASIANDPRVKFISEDREVHTTAQTLPTGINRIDAELNVTNKGTGIGVAVLDTGISLTHPDLAPNIVAEKNCYRPRRSANDDGGHGSHVAGTIAAVNNTVGVVGVAPEVKLIAVKVLSGGGSGSWSSIICGIDWVTEHAAEFNIKVANMSLGGSGGNDNNCGLTNNDALHAAICRSRDAGVTYVVAAGNSGGTTNSFVPAAYDDAVITVSAVVDTNGLPNGGGASTGYGADDTFASFSNYGPAVDIAAPGVNIYSTYRSTGYATISGTSMAAPHVAGAAALYIHSHPGSSWTQVRDGLKQAAESLGSGHTDPSGLHPEPLVRANSL